MDKYIPKSNILPSVKTHMDRLGIASIKELYGLCQNSIVTIAHQERQEIRLPTFSRFYNIVTGVTSAWNLKSGEVSAEADSLSVLFGTSVKTLFGEAPEAIGFSQHDDYPYNKDFHESFKKLMKKAGYKSITALSDSLVTSKKNLLPALSRGQLSPFSNGQWSDLAQEVACLLNIAPEDLFGVRDSQPYLSVDNHPDMVEDGDGWEMDGDTLCYLRDDSDCKLPPSIPLTAQYMGRTFNRNSGYSPECPIDHFRVVSDIEGVPPKSWEELYDLKNLRTRLKMGLESAFDETTSNTRNKSIFYALYGLNLEESFTLAGHGDSNPNPHAMRLEEVGARYGISGERVRQIENVCLRRLKRFPLIQRMKDIFPPV